MADVMTALETATGMLIAEFRARGDRIARLEIAIEALRTDNAARQEAMQEALQVIAQYGMTDGSHHKQWVLDQAARILAGEGYAQWVAHWHGEGWEEGVSP